MTRKTDFWSMPRLACRQAGGVHWPALAAAVGVTAVTLLLMWAFAQWVLPHLLALADRWAGLDPYSRLGLWVLLMIFFGALCWRRYRQWRQRRQGKAEAHAITTGRR